MYTIRLCIGDAYQVQVRDVHSRNSYLASASFGLSYSTVTKALSLYQDGKTTKTEKLRQSYWTWLDYFHQNVILANTDALPAETLGQEAEVGQPILQVGLIGHFGYELKRESLPGYTFTPPPQGQQDSQHA